MRPGSKRTCTTSGSLPVCIEPRAGSGTAAAALVFPEIKTGQLTHVCTDRHYVGKVKPTCDRRRFVLGFAAAATVLSLPATAGSEHDLCYLGFTDDMEGARDHLDAVKAAVGPSPPGALELVRRGETFGVVLRLGAEHAAAAELAVAQDALLREHSDSEERAVQVIERSDTERVFNISYGLGPNLEALRAHFSTVSRMLGPGVARELVIEHTDHDNYALVYKRYGDLESTRVAAARHDQILRAHGVRAAIIQEQAFEVVVDPSTAGKAEPTRAPVGAASPVTPALVKGSDGLRDQINDAVQALRRSGRIADDERTAWLVYDIAADRTLAAINADRPLQAASMIKPLVMLAFFHEVERGRLVYGPNSRRRLAAMIQVSSNNATNWVIDQLGGPSAVQQLLEEHYPALLRHTSVVERIASNGRTYANKASAEDYARYLRALWHDQLPQASEQFRLLNLPGRDRLYHGAPSIPAGTRVYNKTGSTARLCGDMGILAAKRSAGGFQPWIVVGIIEKAQRAANYTRWITSRANVIRQVSDRTYRHMAALYPLA